VIFFERGKDYVVLSLTWAGMAFSRHSIVVYYGGMEWFYAQILVGQLGSIN
jgi:hypothetical protein